MKNGWQSVKGEESVTAKLNLKEKLDFGQCMDKASYKRHRSKDAETDNNVTKKRKSDKIEGFTSGVLKTQNILSGPQYLMDYAYKLTSYERKEINRYSHIYFGGTEKAKEVRNMQGILPSKNNHGFDT